MPGAVVQLFALLAAEMNRNTNDITGPDFELVTLISVGLSCVGSAITLATNAPKSGRRIFNFKFVLHAIYYFAEVTFRVLSVALMMAYNPYLGMLLLVIDFGSVTHTHTHART